MILKNNLYSIVSHDVTPSGHVYNLSLNPECFIYGAHFPGEPITPGVCLLQTSRELLEDATGQRLEIKTVKNAKFLSVVTPRETTDITCSLAKIVSDTATGEVRCQASFATASEAKAKISLICKVND